ncbi:hypothetical protein CLOP_g11850 [Closterium sp. NIES-67]|nr:hypothetical protein CLOP_g11850 [Closterium sp. NIES-67]
MISAHGATSGPLQTYSPQLDRARCSQSRSSQQFTLRLSRAEREAFRGTAAPRGRFPPRAAVSVFAIRGSGGGGSGGDGGAEWWEREEARWEREQQRWEREELRWEREEARWARERASLEAEVAALEAEVESLRAALARAGEGGLAQNFPRLSPQAHVQLAGGVGGGMGGGVGGNGGVGSDLSKEQLLVLLRGLLHLLQVTTDNHRASEVATSAGIATSPDVISGAGAESLLQLLAPKVSATGNAAGASAEEILRNIPDADIIAAVASRTVNPLPAAVDDGGADVESGEQQEEGARKVQRRLARGVYGDDVQQLQALLALQGFYCGEEDTEDAFFGANTESAVKTWQSTMNLSEDGIITPNLFALLIGDPELAAEPASEPPATASTKPSTPPSAPPSPSPSPASSPSKPSQPLSTSPASPRAPPATREKREIERYARSSLEQGQRRVFLLGENRWEDPNTLIGRQADKGEGGEGRREEGEGEEVEEGGVEGKGKGRGGVRDLVEVKGKGKKKGKKGAEGGLKPVVVSCYQCRGEGNVVCMECEGTGDLNIDEQFLDWVGDSACCLYCDGTGAIKCDLCDGIGESED